MLSVGSCLTVTNDVLKPFDMVDLVNFVSHPTSEFDAQVAQLRNIREIDRAAYRKLKVQLPYVVCGTFNPAFRRTENFAYIDCFILDIDMLSEGNRDMAKVFASLTKDKRVLFAFRSPSNDGIKALFRLKDRCYDPGIFKMFYKSFAYCFADEHGIGGFVDVKACDVCRACFLSVDKTSYYNPDAEYVDMTGYLAMDGPESMFDLKHELQKVDETVADMRTEVVRDVDPDDEIINRIKSVLNPAMTKPVKRELYVPVEIETVKDGVKAIVEEVGVQLCEIRNIHYGMKLVMKTERRCAEINVFYGRTGYCVVESPKHGTSSKLNALLGDLIRGYLNTVVRYD